MGYPDSACSIGKVFFGDHLNSQFQPVVNA
jgi:hypothetical protein